MMKNQLVRVILSTIFIGLATSLSSQPNDSWKAGSALSLTGNATSLYCFIETAENRWTETEKADALQALTEAQNWLVQQAACWDVDLSFQNFALQQDATFVFPSIEKGTGSGKESVDWVNRILKKAGFRNAKKAYKALSTAVGNKNIHLLVFAKADGTSYAMRFARGMRKKKYFVEGVLLYQHYGNGVPVPLAAVGAHEILHLYGAWDLYTTYAQTADRHAKAIEHFSDDIMLRVDYDIQRLQVDRLTAWLLGWNTQEEAFFEWFRPSDFKR